MQRATAEQPVSGAALTSATEHSVARPVPRTPEELTNIVLAFASSEGWIEKVRLRVEHRWYERLYQGPDHDIWAISWLPGQSTGFHDHGESAGAFVVATGVLEEHRPGEQLLAIYPFQPRAFGPEYAHDVRNASSAPAVSIHAYSPPLTEMNEYELEGGQLIPRDQASERAETLAQDRPNQQDQPNQQDRHDRKGSPTARTGASSIEQMLSAARARLRRVSPEEAYEAATTAGAILVDIRPEAQRAREGAIPDALIIERNVLEWRLDPTSSARLPIAASHDLQAIVFCSEGYTSSLAAASLQELGLWRATDIVGGFHAWRAAGLPAQAPA